MRDAGRNPRPFCDLVPYDRLPGRHAGGNQGGKRMAESRSCSDRDASAAGMLLRSSSWITGPSILMPCGADYKDSCRSANRPVHRPREALRRSMVSLISKGDPFAHPTTWAPFVPVGEGQASARASTTTTKPKTLPPHSKNPNSARLAERASCTPSGTQVSSGTRLTKPYLPTENPAFPGFLSG
jgi:hypothetical protein